MNRPLAKGRRKGLVIFSGISLLIILSFYFLPSTYYAIPLNHILSLAYGIFIIPFLLKDFRYGLAGFIILAIFPRIQGHEIFGIPGFNTMNILFVFITAFLLIPKILEKQKFITTRTPLMKSMILLFILQFIFLLRIFHSGWYHAGMLQATMQQFVKPFQYFVILFILFHTIKKEKDVRFYLMAFYISLFLVSTLLFVQYLFNDPYSRVMWSHTLAGHKNNFALTIAIFTLMSISIFLNTTKKGQKVLWMVGTLLGFSVLGLSVSRTAYIGFLLSFLYIIFKMKSKKIFAMVLFLALLLFLTPLSDVVFSRASEKLDKSANAITAGRIKGPWARQWAEIRSNPVFGGGFIKRGGHSGILSTWNKLGLLGLFLSIGIFISMFRTSAKIYNKEPSKGLLKAISLSSAACIIMIPAINVSGSLQLIEIKDIGSIFIILFLFLSAVKLDEIKKTEMTDSEHTHPYLDSKK